MKTDYLILVLVILNILLTILVRKNSIRGSEQQNNCSNRRFRRLAKIALVLGKRSKRMQKILNSIGATVGLPKIMQSESVFAVFGIEGLNIFGFEQDIWDGRHSAESRERHLSEYKMPSMFVGGVIKKGKIDCRPLADLLPEDCRFASIHETLAIAKRLRMLGEKRTILCNGWGYTDGRTRPASTYYTHRLAIVENKIISLKAEGSFSFYIEKNGPDEYLSMVELLVAVVRK